MTQLFRLGRCWCLGVLLSAIFLDGSAAAETFEIKNPLILKRADPDIYLHSDGYYYFTATVPAYDQIELRRATTIQGLSTATASVIWKAHASGAMASHIWAPELHYIGNSWYIYFAAGSSTNVWDIRVYLLSNEAANPMSGTWTERGQILTNGPKSDGSYFALDATTFEHNGTRYMVWAESDPSISANTVLLIAPMSNPWTLSARGVRISAPELTWEKQGYAVNEGPAVLKRNGKIFISYSASATDANYCMGLLTAADTSNLLTASSWSKSQVPVFKSANGVYGPGHNQFTTSLDGSVDLLVYHGRDYEKIVGEALDDPNRATRVQPLKWKSDGSPDFGVPSADGTLTVSTPAATSGGTGSGGSSAPRSGTTAGGVPAAGGSSSGVGAGGVASSTENTSSGFGAGGAASSTAGTSSGLGAGGVVWSTGGTSSRVSTGGVASGGAATSVSTRSGASSGGSSAQSSSSSFKSTGGNSLPSEATGGHAVAANGGNPGIIAGYSATSSASSVTPLGGASYGSSAMSQAGGVSSVQSEASRDNGCNCRINTRTGVASESALMLFVAALLARFGRRRSERGPSVAS
jgi:GH43 family beta-xylosidase